MNRNFTTPQPSDILGGRGSKPFNHSGNKMLRVTVANRLEEYSSTGLRQQRSDMITEILDSIRYRGGRFLKYDERQSAWYDAGYSAARCKITSSFRDAGIPNKVKCIDKMRSQCPLPQQKNLIILHDVTSENIVSLRGMGAGFLDQAQQVSHSACDGMPNANEAFEPIQHTASPRVSITFAYFTGDEREDEFAGARVEDFLDAMSEETIDELMLVDRQFPWVEIALDLFR